MQHRSAGKSSAIPNGNKGGALSKDEEALSLRIVEARRNATVLDEFPGQLPTSLEQAYRVQAASMAQWPDEVVGWKVARLSPDDKVRLGKERLVGPVYRSTVETVASGAKAKAKIFDGGFAAIEAEIVLELGADVTPEIDQSRPGDLAGLVSRAFCGAEIASSPMPLVIERGATSIISDMGINSGVIVGPEIDSFLDVKADALKTTVSVDRVVVGEASPGTITGTPFEALQFLIEHCFENDIKLSEGTLVSTGMITGVHEVKVGSTARVDFGDERWFDVSFGSVRGQ